MNGENKQRQKMNLLDDVYWKKRERDDTSEQDVEPPKHKRTSRGFTWIYNHPEVILLLTIASRHYPGVDRDYLLREFAVKAQSFMDSILIRNRESNSEICDFGREHIVDLFVSRDGRCEYNDKIQLLFCPTEDPVLRCHLMSIERLDQSLGYSKKNVCLIALQYNNRIQFSRELLSQLANGSRIPRSCVSAVTEVNRSPVLLYSGKRRIVDHERGLAGCTSCGGLFEFKEFNSLSDGTLWAKCKTCWGAEEKKRRMESPRKFIQSMLSSARTHSKRRARTHRKTCENTDGCEICANSGVEITVDTIAKAFDGSHDGRCAITGYPLSLIPGSPFSLSIDRIDDSFDYKLDNIRLVVACMQTGNNTKWTKENWLRDHIHLLQSGP